MPDLLEFCEFCIDAGMRQQRIEAMKRLGREYKGDEFIDLYDFCLRTETPKKQIESMIKAGAFDSIGLYIEGRWCVGSSWRFKMLEDLEDILNSVKASKLHIAKLKQELLNGQLSLF